MKLPVSISRPCPNNKEASLKRTYKQIESTKETFAPNGNKLW